MFFLQHATIHLHLCMYCSLQTPPTTSGISPNDDQSATDSSVGVKVFLMIFPATCYYTYVYCSLQIPPTGWADYLSGNQMHSRFSLNDNQSATKGPAYNVGVKESSFVNGSGLLHATIHLCLFRLHLQAGQVQNHHLLGQQITSIHHIPGLLLATKWIRSLVRKLQITYIIIYTCTYIYIQMWPSLGKQETVHSASTRLSSFGQNSLTTWEGNGGYIILEGQHECFYLCLHTLCAY